MTTLQLLFQKLDRVGDQQFLTYLKVNRANILELEKEQIIDAYNEPLWITGKPNIRAEEYYEQRHGAAGRAFTQDLIPKN